MGKNINRFDLTNIDDFPKEVKKNICSSNIKNNGSLSLSIISLFDDKETLTINEIIVGLYRKYGYVVVKRINLMNVLGYLCKNKRMKRIAVGV